MLCSDGINRLILFCIESVATLTVLQSKSTGKISAVDFECPTCCYLIKMLLKNSYSTTTLDRTKVSKRREQSKNLAVLPPTIQPRSCSLRLLPLWRSQRCLLLEKVWECWWGCWRSGCKYKFQTDTKKGQILFFVIGTRLLKVDGDYAEKWGV